MVRRGPREVPVDVYAPDSPVVKLPRDELYYKVALTRGERTLLVECGEGNVAGVLNVIGD